MLFFCYITYYSVLALTSRGMLECNIAKYGFLLYCYLDTSLEAFNAESEMFPPSIPIGEPHSDK